MNMKKQVFEYMTRNPEATTADLVAVFPEAKKKSLWNYSRQWKKNSGIEPAANRKSIRQQVFTFITQNPDATQKDLQQAFPDANKVSISNYHYQWRKAQPHLKKRKSVKSIVYSYLESHPDASFRELRNALPAINPSSISAYHSIWKQNRGQSDLKRDSDTSGQKKRPRKKEQLRQMLTEKSQLQRADADHYSAEELIETLQATIKTQEVAIEVMKEQNALLRQSQSVLLTELEKMTSDEWDELRKIIAVFIKGMKID